MKLWIRLEADSPRDPRVGRLAAKLGIPTRHAFGLVVATWCAMGEHAPDGDVSNVAAPTLEEWAGWSPPKPRDAGKFAAAFLETFTVDSVDAEFERQQGALVKRMEKDRTRKTSTDSEETDGIFHGNSTEIPQNRRGISDATERNGTERSATTGDNSSGTRDSTVIDADLALEERLPPQHRTEYRVLMSRIAALPGGNDRFRAWVFSLTGTLDGVGGKSWTPEQIGAAIADFNANGEVNKARFRGYLEKQLHAGDDSSQPGERHNAASPHRTSARDLEAQGLVIWGDLVDGVSQVYKANDPNDAGAGGSNVWTIRAPTWDKLDDSARRALAAIGGAVAIATADAARKGFLSAQFAKTYAGAMMQSAKGAADA